MRLRITITMLEIRNRETLQSKVNICKSDVKIGDYADSLPPPRTRRFPMKIPAGFSRIPFGEYYY